MEAENLATPEGRVAARLYHCLTLDSALLDRYDLHLLADQLRINDPVFVSRCVEFVLSDTKGLGHGRARAKICRRLKHCDLGKAQREQLLSSILGRLRRGDFSEQFRDQLRLALCVGPQSVFEVALDILAGSPKVHIRRYATWILAHRDFRAACE
jgi:hypothetical protein